MSIEQELLALTNADGFINPAEVHAWAEKNPNSALADHLEWDNERAGYLYRLGQIRNLVAVYVRDDEGRRSTISLVADRPYGLGYRKVTDVMSHEDTRAQALRQALVELRRVFDTYGWLHELAGVRAEVDILDRTAQRLVPRRVA